MTDATKLIERLRAQLVRIESALYDTRPKQAVGEMVVHAITLIDVALVNETEARIAANGAEPVVWFGGNNYCTTNREIAERFNLRPAYADPVADSAMAKIREAIADYHFALDLRAHGGVAQDRAFNTICGVLDMHWKQGEETARRTAIAAQTKTGE
jgi:hypothetical protein